MYIRKAGAAQVFRFICFFFKPEKHEKGKNFGFLNYFKKIS